MNICLSLIFGLACMVAVYCAESYKDYTWSRFKDVDTQTKEKSKRYHQLKIGSNLSRRITKLRPNMKSKMPKLSSSLLHNNIMPFLRWVGFYRSIKNSRYWYRKRRSDVPAFTSTHSLKNHQIHGVQGEETHISEHAVMNTVDDAKVMDKASTEDIMNSMKQRYPRKLHRMSSSLMAHELEHTYDCGKKRHSANKIN